MIYSLFTYCFYFFIFILFLIILASYNLKKPLLNFIFFYLYLFYFQVFLSISVLTVQYAAVRSTLLDLMIFNFFSAVLFFRLFFIFALLTYFLSYFLLFRSKFQTVKAENVFAVMTSLFPLEVKDQKYLKRS